MRENVAPTDADDQLKYALKEITRPEERRVSDRSEFRGYLVERSTSRSNVDVDLIGHSDAGILRLGPIVFDLTGIVNLFPPSRHDPANDGISGVRLLGCNTASTAGGQASMRLLKQIIQAPVWGTRDILQADDYEDTGLRPGRGNLVEVDGLAQVVPMTSEQVVSSWRTSMAPALIVDDAERRLALFNGLQGRARPLAGPAGGGAPGAPPQATRVDGAIALPWLREAFLRAPWIGRTRGLQAHTIIRLSIPPTPRPRRPTKPLLVDVIEHAWALRLHGPSDDDSLIVPVDRRALLAILRRLRG